MRTKPISPSHPSLTGQKQELLLTQRLIMSAQMQQALHLLELPVQELEPFIEEQIVLNPILEIEDHKEEEDEDNIAIEKDIDGENDLSISEQDLSILNKLDEEWQEYFAESDSIPFKRTTEDEKFKTYLEQSIYLKPKLHEKLLEQANISFEQPQEKEIAKILIGYIDEYGFLTTPLTEICSLHHFHIDDVADILREIQTFEPNGVGASTIQESLLIQLRNLKKENYLAYQIIAKYYDQLLRNQIPYIQKKIKCSFEQIHNAIEQDIAKLDLHPGSHFSSQPIQPVIPDVSIRQEQNEMYVEVERDTIPGVHLNHQYIKMLNDPTVSNETKNFIKHHILSARWLVRNLQYRYSTIERIVHALIEKQKEFFNHPEGKLIPLTMKALADELNLHESTIARTVSNKYLNCSRGLILLRTFFTHQYNSVDGESISSSTVKQAILDIIDKENKQCPLSDEKISFLLKQRGIQCARRTVSKHRLALKKGNRQQRRKFQNKGTPTKV